VTYDPTKRRGALLPLELSEEEGLAALLRTAERKAYTLAHSHDIGGYPDRAHGMSAIGQGIGEVADHLRPGRPADGSEGKGQLRCQQYPHAHQDDAEWIVGGNFEHCCCLRKNPKRALRRTWGLGCAPGTHHKNAQPRPLEHCDGRSTIGSRN
jgi:hypothetical protein